MEVKKVTGSYKVPRLSLGIGGCAWCRIDGLWHCGGKIKIRHWFNFKIEFVQQVTIAKGVPVVLKDVSAKGLSVGETNIQKSMQDKVFVLSEVDRFDLLCSTGQKEANDQFRKRHNYVQTDRSA